MTKGPWRYEKSGSHHHVIMGDEVLDVSNEADARAIARLPELVKVAKALADTEKKRYTIASAILFNTIQRAKRILKGIRGG